MAKKSKDEELDVNQDNYAELIDKQIEKFFKLPDISVDAETFLSNKNKIIRWSPSIDIQLNGGVPEGSWVSLSGPPKFGKTTAAMTLAANAQKEGKFVYFAPVEGRLKEMNLHGIQGLDTSKNKFRIINSVKGKILSTEDWLNIFEWVLKSHPGCVLIVDSVSALTDKREQDGGVGTETRGNNNKLISKFINNMSNVVPINKSIVVGIVHIIANTSGFGSPTLEKSGNRWMYQADIKLRAKKSIPWKVGGNTGKQIGQIVSWACGCSALGPPGITSTSYLRYGVGLDKLYELIQMAMNLDLIDASGAWYTLSYLAKYKDELGIKVWDDTTKIKAQGGENLYLKIRDNPKYLELLNKEIESNYANLVSYDESSGD